MARSSSASFVLFIPKFIYDTKYDDQDLPTYLMEGSGLFFLLLLLLVLAPLSPKDTRRD